MTTAPATRLAVVDGHRIEYRRHEGGPRTAVVLHGGHMSAACRFGEEPYAEAGRSVLVPSRPGYGRTDVGAGPSAPEFAVRLARLLRQPGLLRPPVSVTGISLGARAALTLAAFFPDLVDRVVLISPVSFARWPGRHTRILARAVFNPASEGLTWGAVHRLLRRDPDRYLPRLITSLSTLPGPEAVRRLGPDAAAAVEFLLSCRSGRGFTVDLSAATDVCADVGQPVLILATRRDGAVSYDHPERLAAALPDARLVELDAPSHLLWLGDTARTTRDQICAFLRERGAVRGQAPGTTQTAASPGS